MVLLVSQITKAPMSVSFLDVFKIDTNFLFLIPTNGAV